MSLEAGIPAPDPDAGEFRELAAQLGELAGAHVRRVFAWIHDELASSGSDGAIAFLLALADHQADEECALGLILGDLLLAADRHMPCPCAQPPAAAPGGAVPHMMGSAAAATGHPDASAWGTGQDRNALRNAEAISQVRPGQPPPDQARSARMPSMPPGSHHGDEDDHDLRALL